MPTKCMDRIPPPRTLHQARIDVDIGGGWFFNINLKQIFTDTTLTGTKFQAYFLRANYLGGAKREHTVVHYSVLITLLLFTNNQVQGDITMNPLDSILGTIIAGFVIAIIIVILV